MNHILPAALPTLHRVANRDLATSIDVFHKAGDRAYTLCVMVFYVSSLIIFFPRLEEEEMVMVLHHSQSLVPPERPVTA